MSPLWALPLLTLAGGLAAVALVARNAVDAAAGLRADMVALRRMVDDVGALRAEAGGIRQRLLDARPGPAGDRRAPVAGSLPDPRGGGPGRRGER